MKMQIILICRAVTMDFYNITTISNFSSNVNFIYLFLLQFFLLDTYIDVKYFRRIKNIY